MIWLVYAYGVWVGFCIGVWAICEWDVHQMRKKAKP